MQSIPDAITALGFRKWYERRLIEAHLYLVTAFVCLIAVLAAVEIAGLFQSAGQTVWVLSIVAFLGWAGVWNWRRYFETLALAAFLAERSDCPACSAYGRFDVLYSGPRQGAQGSPDPHFNQVPVMQVRCRKCAREWRL